MIQFFESCIFQLTDAQSTETKQILENYLILKLFISIISMQKGCTGKDYID